MFNQARILEECGITPWVLKSEFSKKSAVDRGKSVDAAWNDLKLSVAQCENCRFFENRQNVVFGSGKKSARLMIVGESPSPADNLSGNAFSDKNAQILKAMLWAIGLTFEDCFLTFALKCKAEKPSASDIAACRTFLMAQIAQIQPEAILLLGKTAAFSVLDDSRDLHQLRGQVFKVQNSHVVASFHPMYLALNPMEKALAWQDLLTLRAILETVSS